MTTGLITPATNGQKKQLRRVLEKAVSDMNLNKFAMETLLSHGNKLCEDLKMSMAKHSASDERFELFKSFNLTVPQNYNHETQLETFFSSIRENYNFLYLYEEINDESCYLVSHKLMPGRKYKVLVIKITKEVTLSECLDFYSLQGALRVGAQGLSLFWQLKGKDSPWPLSSLDVKDSLVQFENKVWLPSIYKYDEEKTGLGFGLGALENFELKSKGQYLLLFLP